MERLREMLQQYGERYADEIAVAERFSELLEANEACLERDYFTPGHITSSCWLLNPTRDAVLLTHHRKLQRWLQLGGHVEGEKDVLASSVREAQEESGINEIRVLLAEPIDIDIHQIPARKNDPSHYHYDFRFLLQTEHEEIQISEESMDLKWLPLKEVPDFLDEESMLRLHAKCLSWISQ